MNMANRWIPKQSIAQKQAGSYQSSWPEPRLYAKSDTMGEVFEVYVQGKRFEATSLKELDSILEHFKGWK